MLIWLVLWTYCEIWFIYNSGWWFSGLEHLDYFSIQLGMEKSSQLTNSIIFRVGIPPTRWIMIGNINAKSWSRYCKKLHSCTFPIYLCSSPFLDHLAGSAGPDQKCHLNSAGTWSWLAFSPLSIWNVMKQGLQRYFKDYMIILFSFESFWE